MANINIAIDGTSGVGKSTIADILAKNNGMTHLDTGAMYRCVALAISRAQVDLQDEVAVQSILDQIQIGFEDGKVLLNGEDVSVAIRTNDISNFTSKIATIGAVRKKLVFLQRYVASNKGYILDGRDICTTVLPDAEVKIFMSASAKARAQRRYDEYVAKGVEADYDTIYNDIVARDYQDSHRSVSPLYKAQDAIEVDTSMLTIDEVVNVIQAIIDKAL